VAAEGPGDGCDNVTTGSGGGGAGQCGGGG